MFLAQLTCLLGHRLGPLSMERKERKKPARQVRASQANQPSIEEQEEVEQLEGSEMAQAGEKATAKQIKKTMAALQEATETDENGDAIGMNLFKFFIHPTDFAQSVENLFYLSFLSSLSRTSLRGLLEC